MKNKSYIQARRPRGWWNKERVSKEAKKYKTRTDFQNKSRGAYKTAIRKGWLDEVCVHMFSVQRPRGYWNIKANVINEAKNYKTPTEMREASTVAYQRIKKNSWEKEAFRHMKGNYKERKTWDITSLKKEAKKFKTRTDFKAKSSLAYHSACRKGVLDEVCGHMTLIKNPKGTWTKERVLKEAKKHKTRTCFQKNSKGAFAAATRNGWLEEVSKTFAELKHEKGYWTKEIVLKEAKKYKSIKVFRKKSPKAYAAAFRLKVIDQATAHMNKKSAGRRALYGWFFEDGSVYWGITNDQKRREREHYRKGIVANKLEECGAILWQSWDYLSELDAKRLERKKIKQSLKKGQIILNRTKGGETGSQNRRWTRENVLKCARKCKTMAEFRKKQTKAYDAARRYGWLEEAYEGLTSTKVVWTRELVLKEAKKYKRRTDFHKNSGSAFGAASRNGWLEEACSHMIMVLRPKGFWKIKGNVLTVASECSSISDFQKRYSRAYFYARTEDYLSELSKQFK